MKEAIPSISTGSVSAVIASLSGVQIFESIIIAFLGGIAAYIGKLLLEWTIQQIKKIRK